MKNDDLPPDDHIVRYVKPSMIRTDGTPDGADFRLRPNRPDETGLSVNWLEVLESSKDHQLAKVRQLCRLKRKPAARFAELNVGATIRSVSEESMSLRIVHEPLEADEVFEADPSHAEIIGLPPGESDLAILVGDLISQRVIAMHPAVVSGDDV